MMDEVRWSDGQGVLEGWRNRVMPFNAISAATFEVAASHWLQLRIFSQYICLTASVQLNKLFYFEELFFIRLLGFLYEFMR